MGSTGTLIHTDAAFRTIEEIHDPVTRHLTRMFCVDLVKTVALQRTDSLEGDLDMRFLAVACSKFFAEREVLARALEGEKVGAFFED